MRTREILTKIFGIRVGDRVRVRWTCWNKDSSYFRYGYVKKIIKGSETFLVVDFDNGGEYFVRLKDVVLAKRRRKC